MKVLITGANGMVARAAIDHCRSIGDEVVALTHAELDIFDREAVFETFERENFDATLNCAAYTNVDGAETNKEICYEANAFGVQNLALASKQTGRTFVTISTDYVFDGSNSGFYTEEDAPNPQSVYAQSKLEGEILAQQAYENSIIVRSGWIFGAGGTNFLSVMHKFLAEGKRIKAIKDSHGTPTYLTDLAKRLRELAELNKPGVFHVVNSGDGASYLEFAEKVCEIGGFEKSLIEPVSFADLKRPAPRPQSSKLLCLLTEKYGLKPLQNWENALEDLLKSYQPPRA
jgi:dTDP-4-dehydrorhamnose reductase